MRDTIKGSRAFIPGNIPRSAGMRLRRAGEPAGHGWNLGVLGRAPLPKPPQMPTWNSSAAIPGRAQRKQERPGSDRALWGCDTQGCLVPVPAPITAGSQHNPSLPTLECPSRCSPRPELSRCELLRGQTPQNPPESLLPSSCFGHCWEFLGRRFLLSPLASPQLSSHPAVIR